MKSTELKIGNYVHPYDRDDIYTSITELRHNLPVLVGYNSYNYDHVYPIKITEEWLLMLGFERLENHVWADGSATTRLYKKGKLAIEKQDITDGGPWILFRYTRSGGEYITNADFVHQLQNLYFSLTGEELTIKDLA